MARQYRKKSDEEKAFIAIRDSKDVPGAFGFLLESAYIRRDKELNEWVLTDAGQTWFTKYRQPKA